MKYILIGLVVLVFIAGNLFLLVRIWPCEYGGYYNHGAYMFIPGASARGGNVSILHANNFQVVEVTYPSGSRFTCMKCFEFVKKSPKGWEVE